MTTPTTAHLFLSPSQLKDDCKPVFLRLQERSLAFQLIFIIEHWFSPVSDSTICSWYVWDAGLFYYVFLCQSLVSQLLAACITLEQLLICLCSYFCFYAEFLATGTTEKAHRIDPVAAKGLPEILNANYLMLHQAVNFRIASAKEVTISA